MSTNERVDISTVATEAGTIDPVQLALNQKAKLRSKVMQVVPFLGLAFIFIFCLITTSGGLVSASNLANLVDQCLTITILSVGASFIYACGRMDMSVGGVLAMSALIMGKMMLLGTVPLPLIILSGIGVAVGIDLALAAISTYLKVPSFIVSICIMSICTGIISTTVATEEVRIPYSEYSVYNQPSIRVCVLIAIVIVGLIIFYKTRLGRDLKAIGGNETAAQQSGVKMGRSILLAFVCLGVCVGIAAFFSTINSGVVNASTGSTMGLNIIIAIVLGGFPLAGGANAKMVGAIVGALTTVVLTNGLSLMGLDPSNIFVVKGILVIAIVAISYERVKGKEIV